MITLALVQFLGVVREFCCRRVTLSAGVVVAGLALALWGGARLARRGVARGIPATLAARIASHVAATVAETLAVAAAKREARTDSITAARAVARAQPHEGAARRAGKQADSLARSADWEAAYEVRSREVSELLTVDALKDSALVAATRGGTALGTALQLTEVRAARADTLLNESVRVLDQQTGCGFGCRARRLLYVGAFVGGMVAARRLVKA